MVPARWRIDEVADSTGISLPEAPEYDTVSGLVMRELGRVPEVGDRLEIRLPDAADGGRAKPRPDRGARGRPARGRLRPAGGGGGSPTTRRGRQRRGASTGRARGGTNARGTGGGEGMSPVVALLVSVLLLALNGFFVAAEFALVASKRYRLEQTAAGGGRAARAALDGVRELSLMLAGAQLGITLCTLGLGALAEPAIEHLLSPVLRRRAAGGSQPHHRVDLRAGDGDVPAPGGRRDGPEVVGDHRRRAFGDAVGAAVPGLRPGRPAGAVPAQRPGQRDAAAGGATSRISSPRSTARTNCASCWSSPASTGCSVPSSTRC